MNVPKRLSLSEQRKGSGTQFKTIADVRDFYGGSQAHTREQLEKQLDDHDCKLSRDSGCECVELRRVLFEEYEQ